MDSKFAQRCLSFWMALVMVLSLTPISALASEVEDTAPTETEGAPIEAVETSDPASVPVTPEAVQARIDALLDFFDITVNMTDDEIAHAIIMADGDTIQYAIAELNSIDTEMTELQGDKYLALDIEHISRFSRMLTKITTPMLLASTTVLDGNISISDTQNRCTKNTDGTVTLTAMSDRNIDDRVENVITIKNESSNKATVSFDYVPSGGYEYIKIDGTSISSGSTYSKLLDTGGTITITMYGKYYMPWQSPTDASLKLSNLKFQVAVETSNVTFEFDSSKGVVTVDGAVIASGDKKALTMDTGAALVATSNSGVTFLGWIDSATNAVLSTTASFTLKPTNAMTVRAVFITTASDAGWFWAGGGAYLFDDLTKANNYAKSATNKTIILANNGTLSGTHEISSGVTLLIPFNSSNTLITDDMDDHLSEASTVGSEYRRLTMKNGASITVYGGISIGSQAAQLMVGQVGDYGVIAMDEGSAISIENGGRLYAYGYVFYGQGTGGTITAKNGSKIYETAFIMDYPGNTTNTQTLYDAGIFPMRAFTVRNVEVPMTYEAGATENVFYSIWGTMIGGSYPGYFSLIGTENSAPFQLKQGTKLTKSYRGGKQYLTLDGNAALNSLAMTLKISFIGTYPITSAKTSGFPMPSGYNITLNSGELTFGDNVIMTEGSRIEVASGATLNTNGKKFYVLDTADDNGTISASDVHGTAYTQVTTDAVLDVNGTVKVSGGGLYTSDGNACITSSEGTGVIQFENAAVVDTSVTIRYGGIGALNQAIAVTSASLDNSDDSYTETAGSTTAIYNYKNGFWHKDCNGIPTETVTKAATCTDAGSKTVVCTCKIINRTEVISATGHSYSKNTPSSKIVTEATCIAAATYYVQCDNCDYVNTNKTVVSGKVNPNNHTGETYLSGKVDATCTEPGYSGDTHCGGCKQKLSDGNTVSALGHTPAAAVQENVKKATCLESGSYDSVVYCDVCGEEISRTPTVIPVLEHNYVDGFCEHCKQPKVTFTVLHNLALRQEVQIGYWIQVETAAQVEETGILIWNEAAYLAEDQHDIASTTAAKPTMTSRQGYMMGYGEGIRAQNLDTVYYAIPYIKTTDGKYYYAKNADKYAAPDYATEMSGTSAKVQAVVRDLLNFGTNAKNYFTVRDGNDINTLTPINSVLPEESRVLSYTDSMKVTGITPQKNTSATMDCKWRYSTAELEESFHLNHFADENTAFTQMLYWDEDDYASAAEPLSKASATRSDLAVTSRNMGNDSEPDMTSVAKVDKIFAKDLYDWQYVCMYNSADDSYGPIRADSVAAYLTRKMNQIEGLSAEKKTTADSYLYETCKAMLAYSTSAKAYANE